MLMTWLKTSRVGTGPYNIECVRACVRASVSAKRHGATVDHTRRPRAAYANHRRRRLLGLRGDEIEPLCAQTITTVTPNTVVVVCYSRFERIGVKVNASPSSLVVGTRARIFGNATIEPV